jgi:RimJ/RimL family protein N-acetyltransferase
VFSADTVVETERLVLRLPEESDARPLLVIHQDPEVAGLLQVPMPIDDITVAWRNVAMLRGHWHFRGFGQWTVVEKATGEVVGRVGLWYPEGWPGVELGWIIRRDRWGNGLATEAASAALDWGWRHVATDHIISLIQPENSASIRVAEKVGERFEETVSLGGVTFQRFGILRP